ncbi:hypothetical protein SO802_025308 [Lithocarpus litseifolius]|uniref:Uncharacterized protein n=1 Tax=Lithocarpus litseifolius TaxID=425828 RepID=A0AAW2BXD7_9ROSI
MIKARASCLALVGVAIEGFISKPSLEGMQIIELSTFTDPELAKPPIPKRPQLDFDSGRAGYIANTVEQVLLLLRDMDELRNLKKHELFLSVKRDLALATQATHVVEEWVNQAFCEMKEEESKYFAAQKAQLREAENQLAIALTTITELRKKLVLKDKEIEKAKQMAYNQGQKETETHLKSQLPVVCRIFCLQTWIEALNVAGVDSNSELRNPNRAFYPPAIRTRPALQSSVSTSTSALASSTKVP